MGKYVSSHIYLMLSGNHSCSTQEIIHTHVGDHQGVSVVFLAVLDRKSYKHLGDHQGVQDTTKHGR